MWVVRAGEQARYIDEFEAGGYVAVGFHELATDDLAAVGPDGLRARATSPTYRNFAGQLANLAFGIEVGDVVITPRLPKRRDYLVGRVCGPYRHVDPDMPSGHHQRPVTWLGTIDRDDMSREATNTLGSVLTLFRPSRAEAELRSLIAKFDGVSADPSAGTAHGSIGVPETGLGALLPGPTSGLERRTPVQLDVRLDSRGRASVTCDHPALVIEQVPRHVDPAKEWAGVPGIYVLTGTDLQVASVRTGLERTLTTTLIVRPWAYVGLSEDFLGRLSSHRQSKPEWRRAMLVRSAATPFSSDDIKYLEHRVHAVLVETDEVRLDQATPRGNLSAQPRNVPLLDACADTVVSVLRLTGTLI